MEKGKKKATTRTRLLSLRATPEDRALLQRIAEAEGSTEHAVALKGLRLYLARRIGELEVQAQRVARKDAKRKAQARQVPMFKETQPSS
jgi:hypothetical protein